MYTAISFCILHTYAQKDTCNNNDILEITATDVYSYTCRYILKLSYRVNYYNF